MKKIFWLVLLIIAVYYGYNHLMTSNDKEQSEIWNKISPQQQDQSGDGWQTYENKTYANFSLRYPTAWQVEALDQKTVFKNPDNDLTISIYTADNNPSQSDLSLTTTEINTQQVLVFSSKDSSKPIKYTVFNLANKKKLIIEGYGQEYDQIVNNINIASDQKKADQSVDEVVVDDNTTEEKNDDELVIDDTGDKIIDDTTPADEDTSNADEQSPADTGGVDNNEPFVIKLFYPKNDSADDCSKVFGLIKNIDTRYNTDEVNALVSLLQGLSSEEKSQGYTTSIPSDTRLRRLDIKDGLATADFNAPLNSGGGSCNMAFRRAQIEQTLLQFPNIDRVIITVDGDAESALQP